MSVECGICERDSCGGRAEDCPRNTPPTRCKSCGGEAREEWCCEDCGEMFRNDRAEAQPQPSAGEVLTDDAMADALNVAMKAKLARAREKGRGGWENPDECTVSDLWRMMIEHAHKPNLDMVDVANFAGMIWWRLDHNPGEREELLRTHAAPGNGSGGASVMVRRNEGVVLMEEFVSRTVRRSWSFLLLVFALVGAGLVFGGAQVEPRDVADLLVTEWNLVFQISAWTAFALSVFRILDDFVQHRPFDVKFALSRFGFLAWLVFLPHRGFLDFLLSGVVFVLGFGLVELALRLRRWQADEALVDAPVKAFTTPVTHECRASAPEVNA